MVMPGSKYLASTGVHVEIDAFIRIMPQACLVYARYSISVCTYGIVFPVVELHVHLYICVPTLIDFHKSQVLSSPISIQLSWQE